MGVNSLPKIVTWQRRGYDLNPGPSAPESSMLNIITCSSVENSEASVVLARRLTGQFGHHCQGHLRSQSLTTPPIGGVYGY